MSASDNRIDKLLKRRAKVVASAPNLAEILRGSVRERFVRCGKEGCHCRKGKGHGPVFFLSVSLGVGRTEQSTLTPETYEIARRYSDNFAKLWEVLKEISSINREILQEQRRTQKQKRRVGK